MKKTLLLLSIAIFPITFLGLKASEREIVAIYTEDASGRNIVEFVGDFLINAIVKRGEFIAIDITAQTLADTEAERQRSGAVTDRMIQKIGESYGAVLLCRVRIAESNGQLFISARLLERQTLVLRTTSRPVRFDPDNWDDIEKACEAIVTSMFGTDARGGGTTPKPPAGSAQPLTEEGCNNNTPGWGESLGTVSFVTNRTWQIGDQIWSDAVTATACQKTTFNGRSYGFNSDCITNNPGFAGNLFSWCAVARFGATLCPHPWRVPTQQDFIALDQALGGSGKGGYAGSSFITANYINRWGGSYGGGCSSDGTLNHQGSHASYWSQTEDDAIFGRHLSFATDGFVYQSSNSKSLGFTLRCVR